MRLLQVLVDSGVLAALFEQIESSGQWWGALAAVTALYAVHSYFRFFRKTGREESLSVLTLFLASGLLLFWHLAQYDAWQLCAVTAQPCRSAMYPHIAAMLSLAALFYLSWIRSELSLESMAASLISAITLATSTWVLLYGLSRNCLSTTGSIQDAGLTVLLVMLAARAYFSPSVGRWNMGPRLIFWVPSGLFVFYLLMSNLIVVLRSPLPAVSNGRLRVSEQFLTTLLIAEDPIFVRHRGLDFSRIRNDLRETIEIMHFKRGSSTITMQLAKVRYLSPEKTLWRKLHQMLLAVLLECFYTKQEILNSYLESVPFGNGIVGITAAARWYYDTEPARLTLDQSLALVVTIFDPTSYTPAMRTMPSKALFRAVAIKARMRVFQKAVRQQILPLISDSQST